MKIKVTTVTQETVIATAGEFRVTLRDYEDSVKAFSLKAGKEASERVLANPRFQRDMTVSAVQWQVILANAKTSGVVVPTERRAELSKAHGLPEDSAVIDLLALPQLLYERYIDEMTDEELFRIFQHRKRRLSGFVDIADNRPTESQIDAYLAEHADNVEKFFKQNPGRYAGPAQAQLAAIRCSDAEKSEALRKLYVKSIVKGEEFANNNDCDILHGRKNPLVLPEDQSEAFRHAVGDVFERDGVLYKILALEEPRIATWDDALKRRVCTDLLAESVKSEAALESERLAFEQQPFLDFQENYRNYPHLLKAVTEGALKGNILDNAHAVSFELSETLPSPDDFNASKQAFVAELKSEDPSVYMDMLMASQQISGITFNLKILEKKYGSLGPDGKIRK